MPNGDLKDLTKLSDRELMLLTAQEVGHIKSEQESIRKEFKSTTEEFHQIVTNCRQGERQEKIERNKKVDDNFKESFTRIDGLESWRDRYALVFIALGTAVTASIARIFGLK